MTDVFSNVVQVMKKSQEPAPPTLKKQTTLRQKFNFKMTPEEKKFQEHLQKCKEIKKMNKGSVGG